MTMLIIITEARIRFRELSMNLQVQASEGIPQIILEDMLMTLDPM